ncbi:CaiB/BaiF CoA transferase family protein [Ramlibacter rhizophilus]|uniref:CoA transferase n=1 Tax=Ramlibacter rhizophilus TaxID=1781167 RepID=A0A4Z0BZL3_9BURK|nr:CaiB/BaiF CoA-transferase family protein [Ramlibacter rhizophilus]TFZ04411.1 CoA transferase [Ramlibacter rhizophilus]
MPAIHAGQALAKLRVLDLSRVRAGPTCVRMLADFGADVVRIEPPPGVDDNENMFVDSREGSDFQNLNRNKRSLTLNLKHPQGRAVLQRLVRDADVVVENWRPDVKHRLGIDYESLRAINPRVILASISGFGQDGPYAGRPGFDQVIQGMGGLMSVTGFPEHGPVRAGIAVADSSAGLYLALGIFAALLEREQSGQGQWVQASLLHAQIAMMDFQAARWLNEGQVPVACGNDHPTASPMGLFRASDGQVNIGVAGSGNWRRFCEVLGQPGWMEDARFLDVKDRIANRAALTVEIERVLGTQPVSHWVEALNRAGVPAGPVYSVPEVFEDPQVRHLDVVAEATSAGGRKRRFITQPVQLSRTPGSVRSAAPGCGQHTDEVLREAGYEDAQIRALREAGVV